MLLHVFFAALTQDRGQRLAVGLLTDRAIGINSEFVTALLILSDESGDELAKEDGAAIAQNGAILLGSVCCDVQLGLLDDTALKHDSAWLVDWNLLIS